MHKPDNIDMQSNKQTTQMHKPDNIDMQSNKQTTLFSLRKKERKYT